MLLPQTAPPAGQPGDLPSQLGQEARGLMAAGRLLCAPAVVSVLNRRLGGGLTDEMVLSLTAALPEGMGQAGCVCGALTGAQVALGLFLGQGGYSRRMAQASRALHDGFRAAHGATCCRALTKKAKGRGERKELCADLTGLAAELAARLILQARPELGQGEGEGAAGEAPRARRGFLGRVLAL